MGLNLRKIRDAAFAQINPFDGGKTANTVWNNTPVGYKDQAQTIRPTGLASRNGTIYIDQQARQVSQARPQQSFIPGNQQKPSGFMGALNDAFDANTANDIAKRNQAELAKAQMAKENGRVYAPKLNQTYTQQQTALGNRSYTNPIQSIAYGLAKDPAKGINSLAGAYAKGLEGTAGLTAIAASKLVNTSDEFQNNLQQEVGNRMNAPIAFSNKGGLLGQGTNFKTAQELDNKKKFASSMVKTGVDVGSVIPVGGGAAQGTGIIAKQGAKQLIGNSLLNAGLSGTQSIATQVNENRPIDLKEAGLSTLAGGALPVVAFGAGRLLKGASNEVGKKLKMNQTGAIPLDPKNNPLGKGAPIEKTPQVGKIDPMASLKQEAKGFKTADEFVDYAMSKRSYDPANAKIGDNIRIDTVGQNGTTTVQGKIVDINTSVNMVDGAVTDPGLHKNTFIKIEQPDGSIVEMPAQKIPGKRMYSNADYAYSPKELADIHAQSTTPQATSGAPIEKTPKTPQQIKQSLNEGFLDIDTSNREAVKSVFDNAGYVDNGGFKVHPNVDQRWVDDLSPETKQLMADEGITYIDPSPDQDVWAMAVQKNLGNNKVKGISVNSKKDAGLFTNKDSIVAHEIGHHKWNQLTPAEKAEWANRPAQSEFGKRIEAGHQHSGAMKGEEEFAEQYARSKTGTYGSGDKPLRVQGAPIEKTPLEALKAEARKYKSAEEFANSLNAMKYGKVTGVGQLPVSKINKTQIKALTERGLPHTDTNLKVSDFKPGRQVTQPLEVYSKGGSWVVENGNHRLAQALANGDETVPVVFKGGEGKKYSTPIADLYNQAHTQPTPKVEAPKLNTPSIRPAYRETKLKKAEYRELGITDANLKQAEIMANDYIGRVDKAKSKAEVERIANKGYAELSDYPGGPSFQKSLADAEVYRKQHLIDTGVESSGIEPTRPHEKPTETSAEQAARGQAEFERRVKMAGLTLDENGNIATQAPQPTVAPKGAPIEKTPQPKSAPIEKTYVVPKTNSTDVTKLADKDLQYFAKQGYTSITDRYGNTRNITPVKTDGIERLDSLNPTGGIYVDYNPKARATMPLADNINTLDKTARKAPDELVTIYRGAPSNQKSINPGDFITTNKELAKSYTGDGNVLEMKVPASHILDDVNSPLGEEYLYRPTKSGAPIEKTPTRAQAMNKVAVAASEAPKLKTPNDLLPNGVDETLAKIDAQNKLMFAKSEATGATPKPKVKSAPKPVVKAAQPTKPNVVKSEVTKKKGFNDFVDEIAQSQGIETKYNAPEMFTFNKVLNKVSGGKMQNLMQISPARLASQKVEDKVASVAQKANVSRKGSKTLNTSRTMFAQTGISDADKMANRRFRDSQSLASDLTKGEMKISDDLASKLADPEKSLDNVYRVIADEKILERTHGKGARLKTKDLTPEEQTIANRIIDAQKRTNEINYRIGRITKEQYDAEKATGHYARMFNIESKGGKQLGKKPIDTMPFQERKDPAEFSDSLMELFIKDPFRGALARQEIAMRSLASHEFMGELVKQGRLLDRKPNKGFQQLNGKKYGKYDGMWADNTTRTQIKQNMEFESDWAKKYVGQLLDDYKSNVMGKTQRVLKATKTVLNPGTNVQNIMSNILFFNRGSGVGVIRNATGMARAAKDLAKAKGGKLNAELIQAKKLGVFGNDSGKAMVGDIGAESLASMPDKKNVIMKGLGVAEDIYGGTDNAAKLGLWRNLQKKGLSPEDAAKQVQKFTQDYHNVGRIVGAMADAPVLGKPFARFIPELVRLTKNNLAYNPAGTIAGLAAIAYAGNALSEKAGETDEERANREGVIGNTSLPGTRYINKALGGPDRDISLNFAVGDSSVNIARAVGLNFPSEPGQDPNRALLEQLLPFEIPTRKDAQGNEVFDGTKIVTHLGLRPIIETVADRNFMGQSIKDPENKTRVEGSELGKTYTGDIPSSEQKKNVASHLARAYLPMGNEIDSLVAAFKGEPNAMGKERTPMQAALRTVGVKVEKNDQATRDKRAGTKEFFEGKLGQVNDFLNKNPDLKDEYLKIKSGTIDRNTDRKVVDLVGPEKWQKISAEKSGRLFDQMKAEDEYQHQQDSTYPIDPIFSNQLSKEQRNQLLEIRSRSSGVGIEQEEILRATKPWYQNFEAAERDRNTKLSAYFDKLKSEGKLKDTQNERVKEYAALYDKYAPQQTPLMTKYYQLKDSNPDAAKALFSTNPELSDQFDAYKEQKLKYINEKRKIEGVPAIDRNTFMNVTFGYEDDERKVFNELKYGRGYGGYSKGGYSRRGGGSGGGGSGDGLASEYDNPYKYAVSIKAKGSSKATVKLGGKIAKRGVTAKATSKPKVTIKKSTA